ncbi:MAG: VOC family protein [Bacteroidetes bacterium]|jgi:predicted enzyme related to lactoylglutathione lyase|nr:VOC family protein [Bacteroidota bacterium]
MMKNTLTWFEIPAADLDRAMSYYGTLLNAKLEATTMAGEKSNMKMAMLPYQQQEGGVGGALVKSDMHKPATTGTVVYLDVTGRLDQVLSAVPQQGGMVLMPKTSLGEHLGHIALMKDTEGNVVGLHDLS